MGSRDSKDRCNDRPQPISSTSAIPPNLPLRALTPSRPQQIVNTIDSIETIEIIPALNGPRDHDSLNTTHLFQGLINENHSVLQEISLRVNHGLISEEVATEELLLLALTHSLNIPREMAMRALPSLRESVREDTELLEDLRSLWRQKP